MDMKFIPERLFMPQAIELCATSAFEIPVLIEDGSGTLRILFCNIIEKTKEKAIERAVEMVKQEYPNCKILAEVGKYIYEVKE